MMITTYTEIDSGTCKGTVFADYINNFVSQVFAKKGEVKSISLAHTGDPGTLVAGGVSYTADMRECSHYISQNGLTGPILLRAQVMAPMVTHATPRVTSEMCSLDDCLAFIDTFTPPPL